MRTAFLETLTALARDDPRIELVVGDLGFGVVEAFAAEFPERFLNVGVAEQNMTGVATGLALMGSLVFTYSIANFPTLRCLEQVRNDVCYHDANVKIVAVGGGLAYGQLGASHHATEDLAIMRSLPRMSVAAPGDPVETAAITKEFVRVNGPGYLRLGKAGEPVVHGGRVDLPMGSSIQLSAGEDVGLLVTGGLLPTAMRVAELLVASGRTTRVVSMPWLKPIDEERIRDVATNSELVVTLEEHSVLGGLGGAVAEVVAEMEDSSPLLRIGLDSKFTSMVGDQEFLRQALGLSAESVADRISSRLWATASFRSRRPSAVDAERG